MNKKRVRKYALFYRRNMIFSGIEKNSLVDFDDVLACTVFTAGCNFRCPFCHNSALVIGSENQRISEEEVFAILNKRKGIIDGVCVTGGEPTMHPQIEFFYEKVKNLGLKTKLDTNGTNPELLKRLNKEGLLDYVAMDIKSSFDDYFAITGGAVKSTEKIEESADFLLEGRVDYEFRTTLVDRFHSEQNFFKIADRLKGAKKYCLQKFEDKGNCLSEGLNAIEKEQAEIFADVLRKTVLTVKLRGY